VILGLHVNEMRWPGGPAQMRQQLTAIAHTAEAVGFARLTVMDHVWPIYGDKEGEMLEGYTTLGFLAAHTNRLELFTMVTGVTYRPPGLLAKLVSTLDVLSGGRAWLGIGAGWNEDEALGLGLPFPSLAERFERLEEALQICLQMWCENVGPYQGTHYQLASTLNVPQPLTRPRIMIGGGGEKKTMRLVAKYADACNIFGSPEAPRKLDARREHCERENRSYDAIEKTALTPLAVAGDGGPQELLERLRGLHEMGFTAVHGGVPGGADPAVLEVIGREIIPEIATWQSSH
jgi:F420-dependent oxidoreductase-like protein